MLRRNCQAFNSTILCFFFLSFLPMNRDNNAIYVVKYKHHRCCIICCSCTSYYTYRIKAGSDYKSINLIKRFFHSFRKGPFFCDHGAHANPRHKCIILVFLWTLNVVLQSSLNVKRGKWMNMLIKGVIWWTAIISNWITVFHSL